MVRLSKNRSMLHVVTIPEFPIKLQIIFLQHMTKESDRNPSVVQRHV
jgi:hypothetical protein